MKKISFRASQATTLDRLLTESKETGFSKSLCRKLIVTGFVYINGKRALGVSHSLKGNEVIDIYFDERAHKNYREESATRLLRVIYEDDAIICFDKPADLPTQPTIDAKRPNLYDLARKQLQGTTKSLPYLGMHHRLDRDTSGVILFTRHQSHNAFVAEQFSKHLCSKTYVAAIHGSPGKKSGTIETFLGSLGKLGPDKLQKFGTIRSGGKKAITEYSVLESNKKFSLVEVKIKTGRTHQIRVHLSEMGHPVVGDTLYGSPHQFFQKLKRHLLHAHVLTITHPVTLNSIRIESPVPSSFRELL